MDDGTSGPRQCRVCGKPLYPNNKTGICSGRGSTAACKSARTESQDRKSRAVPASAREACAVCGSKLRSDNLVGVCGKTPECREEMAKRRREARQKQSPASRKPTNRPRRVPAIPAGTVFGRWMTLEESPKGGDLKVLCRCECERGTERRVLIGSLKRGLSKSCGCLKKETCGRWLRQEGPYLPAGSVSGRITTLEDAVKAADDVRVRCECGNETVKNAQRIKSGIIASCDCLVGEILRTHGLSGHPLYAIWRGIVNRGSNPDSRDYWKYGAIGRTTCEGYRTAPDGLLRFAADMGPRPSRDHSTDRQDNDGGYWCGRCPECLRNGWLLNVAWGTREQQQNNLSINVTVTARRIAQRAETARPAKLRRRRAEPPLQGALF